MSTALDAVWRDVRQGGRLIMELACAAVLFDLDGTLIDSTEWVTRQWTRWARDRGLDAQRVLEVCHGRRTIEVMSMVAPHVATQDEVDRFLGEAVHDRSGIESVRGARQLLASLPANRYAVVTSAARSIAVMCLECAGLPVPDRIVTAEDVQIGKPLPAPYLLAASRLDVQPADCVVFEDAPSGITSARAAGMRVVAVTTTFRDDELECDWLIEDLTQVEVHVDAGSTTIRIRSRIGRSRDD